MLQKKSRLKRNLVAYWYEKDIAERTAFVFIDGEIYEGDYHTDAQKKYLDKYVPDHDFDGRSRSDGEGWLDFEEVPYAYGALYYDNKAAFLDPDYDYAAFGTSMNDVAQAVKRAHPDFNVYLDQQTEYPLEEAEKYYEKIL